MTRDRHIFHYCCTVNSDICRTESLQWPFLQFDRLSFFRGHLLPRQKHFFFYWEEKSAENFARLVSPPTEEKSWKKLAQWKVLFSPFIIGTGRQIENDAL